MSPHWEGSLRKIDDYRWEIPQDYKPGMRVPGLIYASEAMIKTICADQAPEQVVNVTFLPGIVDHSLAMPDIHWGYGFPIGAVAATRIEDGVVSPGGVGFDINCGVRLLCTNLTVAEVNPKIDELASALFTNIPSGLGSKGKVRVSQKDVNEILTKGARWTVEHGFGTASDLDVTEDNGCMEGADPAQVSDKATERGMPQLGTLGSGNHFLEICKVQEIYQSEVAQVMGIMEVGQIMVFIHTGSRGLGHQICTDYVRIMGEAVRRYGIELPDRQLACAPTKSAEGQAYLTAMACAANYAWANRQCITHWVRETFAQIFHKSSSYLGLNLVYDVAHNIAKIETHVTHGKEVTLCVHRKGATRAFPANHPDIPEMYRDVGQPVFIPGDMGRYSYILVGTKRAMTETFGSTCHGAGRVQSRSAAKRDMRGQDVAKELASRGIIVKTGRISSLAEETSQAYKDVAEVVEVTHRAELSRKVAKMHPIGVIKG